jgi:hypothetical protein
MTWSIWSLMTQKSGAGYLGSTGHGHYGENATDESSKTSRRTSDGD